MTTDYDAIAEEYKEAETATWRQYIESFTLMGLLGDLTGKTVVDWACGEGFYTAPAPSTRGRKGYWHRSVRADDRAGPRPGGPAPPGDRVPRRRRARPGAAGGNTTWPSPPTCSTTPATAMSWAPCAGASRAV